MIDGKVNVLKLDNRVSNGNLVINYDDKDSVLFKYMWYLSNHN